MDYANQGISEAPAAYDPRYDQQRILGGMKSLNTLRTTTAQQVLDEQEKAISELHGAISELADRLLVVLGPSLPQTAGQLEKQGPPSPNLVDRISSLGRAINSARSRLSELMQRLQV